MSTVRSKASWEQHVTAFQESGMSQREYCRVKGLKPKSLQYHLRKKRRAGAENPPTLEKHHGWLPITVVDEPEKSGPGGIRFHISRITIEADRGFDQAILANMLRAAGAVC
jgi:hypothetical protein